MPALPYALITCDNDASDDATATHVRVADITQAPQVPEPATVIHSDEDLIVRLGRMPVELAAPLLRADLPDLTPSALLALINVTGEAHHRLIAARPGLDWRVIKALLRGYHDGPIAALALNTTLTFDAEDAQAFARRAQGSPEIHAAVAANPALANAQTTAPTIAASDTGHSNLKLVVLLRAGETAAFVSELARRLDCPPARLSAVLTASSPVPLALTLRAAGLDRAVFLHVLPFWQAANSGEPCLPEGARPILLSLFTLAPADALRKLEILLRS